MALRTTLLHPTQGETKEMESIITIRFLEQGCEELEKLAQLHDLVDLQSLTCGAEVSWQSTDIIKVRRESQGLTLFGALGNLLYRDRGFATSKPVTADYYLSNPQTLCLRTEYIIIQYLRKRLNSLVVNIVPDKASFPVPVNN